MQIRCLPCQLTSNVMTVEKLSAQGMLKVMLPRTEDAIGVLRLVWLCKIWATTCVQRCIGEEGSPVPDEDRMTIECVLAPPA